MLWVMAISLSCSFPVSHQTCGSVNTGFSDCHWGQKSFTAAQNSSDFNSRVLDFHIPRPRGFECPRCTLMDTIWWSEYEKGSHAWPRTCDLHALGVQKRSKRQPTKCRPLNQVNKFAVGFFTQKTSSRDSESTKVSKCVIPLSPKVSSPHVLSKWVSDTQLKLPAMIVSTLRDAKGYQKNVSRWECLFDT